MTKIKYYLSACAAMLLFAVAMGNARAETYTEYVQQCINENVAGGYDRGMVTTYCLCMDNLIPEGEERTVTEWAKTHPEEEAKCTRAGGWK